MEKGYVFLTGLAVELRTSLSWSKEKPSTQSRFFYSPPKERSKLLSYRGDFGSLEDCAKEAYRCPNCRIVMFSYEKEKEEKQNNSS